MKNEDFHEVWWIYSPRNEVWAGLRIAHFRKTVNGSLLFIIPGDAPDRTGVRIWDECQRTRRLDQNRADTDPPHHCFR